MIDRLCALAIARRRWVLAVAALVFLLAATFGVPVVGILKSENSDFQDPAAQNQQVLRAIERATGQTATYGVVALVPVAGDHRRSIPHSVHATGSTGLPSGQPSDAATQSQSARVVALLARQPGFQRAIDYPATHLPELLSRDGRLTLVLAAYANRDYSTHAVEHVRPLAGPGVRFGGNDVAFNQINKETSSDLQRAEMLAFPILLLLSFWVFRGLVAAALPLLVGGFAIVLTFLLLRFVDATVTPLSIFAVNLVTGMGLGLGIDYSLFVLARYREELAGGADVRAALGRTLHTAGRTVLYSSLTVAGALASMLVFPIRFLYSMGVGGAIVALCAGAVTLLVLPAVLVALGPRINSLAPARLQRSAAANAHASEDGAWYRFARSVMRRPGLVAMATAAVLLIAALPSLRVELTPADAHVLPASAEARQVAQTLTEDFPVDPSQTITIVARAPAGASRQLAAIAGRAQRIAGAQAQLAPPRYLGRSTWQIELQPRGVEGSAANQGLVKRLRTIAVDGTSSPLLVGGATAWFVDQKAAISAHLPLALAILAIVTGGFLFLMTGSLVLPLLALAMNLLTVAVAAGLLVLIFQDGRFSSLFGFTPIGGLEESNLVLLFILAFALSTDYGVFLFGRIKEAHDGGLTAREAVALGLERTGRLVTAAALLFCVALGAFTTSHIFFVKQLGVGVPLAVAIDATVVRALLVPALMGRLGEWVWWAPRPLRRLHARFGLSEGPVPEPSGA
ncbi:MAG TPA: MMPL family transporter [Solirubrobacteraceae bacterium]|nr:MMPL family transporter [Solirubrobacteraceae bacterium]